MAPKKNSAKDKEVSVMQRNGKHDEIDELDLEEDFLEEPDHAVDNSAATEEEEEALEEEAVAETEGIEPTRVALSETDKETEELVRDAERLVRDAERLAQAAELGQGAADMRECFGTDDLGEVDRLATAHHRDVK